MLYRGWRESKSRPNRGEGPLGLPLVSCLNTAWRKKKESWASCWRVGLCCQPEGCWVPANGDSKERGGERLAGHALGRQLGRVRGKGGVGPRGEGRAWMGRLLRQRWLSPFFSSFLFRNLFPIKLLSIDK